LQVLSAALIVAGCTARTERDATAEAPPARPAPKGVVGERHVYFGELHLHTSFSFDAWAAVGTKTTPEQAYKFMQGEPVMVEGVLQKRAWPLDFGAVTDHSENMGVLAQLDAPGSLFALTEVGKRILADPVRAGAILLNAKAHNRVPSEMNPSAAMASAWDREKAAANANYRPGEFTTFIAYEWSSTRDNKYNLHRNVIFRGDKAPLPFTSVDSRKPEDLWTYLEENRARGIEALAIPHNGNVSGGLMYDWNNSDGRPIDEAYAQRRALNEPVTEIIQIKGQSEAHPDISTSDEFANFEIYDELLIGTGEKSVPRGSYIRDAFGRGLIIQRKVGANPYKMGVVGGSDIHNGLSSGEENAMAGKASAMDPNTALPDREEAKHRLNLIPTPSPFGQMRPHPGGPGNIDYSVMSSAGITGVWAEENTRDSIFAALKRRETFATSGPRMRVRVFGGWSFSTKTLREPNWVTQAYAQGVPMGGDLPVRPPGNNAPSFIIQAVKAPESGNLDRVQMVKVWLAGQKYAEKVFDVALSGGRKVDPKTGKAPPVGDTVDLRTGSYTNSIGAPSLETVWHDPEFDPAIPAVYYVRVLEIPTPRWTTLMAVKRQLPFPSGVPKVIQERAYASPIWYTPPAPLPPAEKGN
jgi:hypothetical protein